MQSGLGISYIQKNVRNVTDNNAMLRINAGRSHSSSVPEHEHTCTYTLNACRVSSCARSDFAVVTSSSSCTYLIYVGRYFFKIVCKDCNAGLND